MLTTVISIITNQFFLMFLAIATGLLIGKIKIGNFSLGVSGGIFSGIIIGYIATSWAHTVEQGQVGFEDASRILNNGVVGSVFFTFFLMLFLVSIGMKVGGGIGAIFKKYGIKFVVIGVTIPLISIIIACIAYQLVLKNNPSMEDYQQMQTGKPILKVYMQLERYVVAME